MFEKITIKKVNPLLVDGDIAGIQEISYMESCILTQLRYYDNSENHCWVSNKVLSEYFKVSERTISRAISHLEELELISVHLCTNDNKTKRRIIVLFREDCDYSDRVVDNLSSNNEKVVDNLSKQIKGFNLKENNIKSTTSTMGNVTYGDSICEENVKSSISDETEKLDMDIVSKSVLKCCRELNIPMDMATELDFIIGYYYTKYESAIGESHPRLKHDLMKRVVDSLYSGTANTECYTCDLDTYKQLVDRHFITNYKYTDYNILHFTENNVQDILYYQVLH